MTVTGTCRAAVRSAEPPRLEGAVPPTRSSIGPVRRAVRPYGPRAAGTKVESSGIRTRVILVDSIGDRFDTDDRKREPARCGALLSPGRPSAVGSLWTGHIRRPVP